MDLTRIRPGTGRELSVRRTNAINVMVAAAIETVKRIALHLAKATAIAICKVIQTSISKKMDPETSSLMNGTPGAPGATQQNISGLYGNNTPYQNNQAPYGQNYYGNSYPPASKNAPAQSFPGF